MKKFALFFFLPICIYGVELIPQKLILTLSDKSPSYKMEGLLQKTILSKAKNIKDIYIFSDDNAELKGYGLSQVNAKILLTLKEEKENFIVELYDITKETVKLDINISFQKNEYLKKIDLISSNILDKLKILYQPKEKQKLITVETEKKKLSEYEKDKPTFSLSLYFNLDNIVVKDIEFNLGESASISGKSEPDLSFSPQLNFEFEYMWFLFIAKARINTTENFVYTFSFSPLFGLFNNLLFLGPFFSFSNGKFVSFEVSGAGKTIFCPNFYYSFLTIGAEFRFNITRNYYLGLGFGFLRPYSEIGFNFDNKEIKISMNSSDGPPYLFMNFNIRVLEKLIVSFGFSFYFCGIKREFNDPEFPPPIELTVINGEILYLKKIHIENSAMGIGIKYEF